MTSLGEEYPKEQARCREVLAIYEGLGPSGTIGAVFIRDMLRRADEAAVSGDLVEMIKIYKEMKETE